MAEAAGWMNAAGLAQSLPICSAGLDGLAKMEQAALSASCTQHGSPVSARREAAQDMSMLPRPHN